MRLAIGPLFVGICTLPALSQQAVRAVTARPTPHGATAAQSLPIRRVTLYKNGVGFFEHTGTVAGTEAVTIDFTTAQLNDVLQTLTAVDLGGGHVQGAGYNSTTPLDQQLRSLPLALGSDATATDLYAALRGVRVEVSGDGASFSGRILNVELRDVAVPAPKTEGESTTNAVQRPFLTVVSEAGTVRTVELTGRVAVRLLDTGIQSGVERYLETLAANHQDGLRHLTLTDAGGAAPRELRVSYISEVPVWKCTYRLLFDGKTAAPGVTTATVQGWAVVDNTVGSDWTNVQLSLVAGAPQSFIQPISQPAYARRPEIPLPQEVQLTPQTHESGNTVAASGIALGSGSGLGYGVGSGMGVGGGSNRAGVNSAAQTVQVTNGAMDHLSRLAARPTGPAPSFEEVATTSVVPQTTTSGFDDYFEYTLTEPVTIRKNESALVPILQAKIEVDPVTLWSPADAQPLRALWVRNTSGLTLDRGSFSVLQNGNFSGQGLLDPIHPGERRLLSYAADQAVHVTVEDPSSRADTPRRVEQITLARGVMTVRSEERTEHTLLVRNAAPEARTVVLEQPRQTGWTLTSDTKPEETTTNAYRFRVRAAAGSTERLRVAERRVLSSRYQLVNLSEDQVLLILKQDGDPPGITQALQPVLTAKRQLADLDAQIAERNTRIAAITADQARLRQNLQALKGSSEERALATRYTGELNGQEDELGRLHTELASLRKQQQDTRDALATLLENLTADVTL